MKKFFFAMLASGDFFVSKSALKKKSMNLRMTVFMRCTRPYFFKKHINMLI